MTQNQPPNFDISESQKILNQIPFGDVETYWIEFDTAILDDPHSFETRARAAGIHMLFSERYGPVFRTTLPVIATESYEDKEDRQWHVDEIVGNIEWLLSGTTGVIPRPEALFGLKLLTTVPRGFEGDSVPNTGAQLVEASLDAVRKKLNPAVYDLLVLYLSQLSQAQTGESAEETLAFLKECWEAGDVGAAEKHRERTTTAMNFDWVAEAERLGD